MRVIPRSINGQIAFHKDHAPAFAEHAAALGLSEEKTAAYVALTAELEAKVAAAHKLEAVYRAAIVEQDGVLERTHALASCLVQMVRAQARAGGSVEPFVLAHLPVPSAGSPIHPVNPANITFELRPTGELTISWQGSSDHGTIFEIRRSIQRDNEPPTPMRSIGHVGTKTFVDHTIPPGTVSATYVIAARKGSETTSGSSPVSIRFAGAAKPSLTLAGAA